MPDISGTGIAPTGSSGDGSTPPPSQSPNSGLPNFFGNNRFNQPSIPPNSNVIAPVKPSTQVISNAACKPIYNNQNVLDALNGILANPQILASKGVRVTPDFINQVQSLLSQQISIAKIVGNTCDVNEKPVLERNRCIANGGTWSNGECTYPAKTPTIPSTPKSNVFDPYGSGSIFKPFTQPCTSCGQCYTGCLESGCKQDTSPICNDFFKKGASASQTINPGCTPVYDNQSTINSLRSALSAELAKSNIIGQTCGSTNQIVVGQSGRSNAMNGIVVGQSGGSINSIVADSSGGPTGNITAGGF